MTCYYVGTRYLYLKKKYNRTQSWFLKLRMNQISGCNQLYCVVL